MDILHLLFMITANKDVLGLKFSLGLWDREAFYANAVWGRGQIFAIILINSVVLTVYAVNFIMMKTFKKLLWHPPLKFV